MKLVITDLDGTLLDHASYRWDEARPALARLRAGGVPLVFCTSKTQAETAIWRQRLENRHPFIVENGGAILIPRGYFPAPALGALHRGAYDAIVLGVPYPQLTAALRAAAEESGCPVRGFADMDVAEIAELCEMTEADAEQARKRAYDEPFLVLSPQREAALLQAIERRGLRSTRGGRFHHIMGPCDKAAAVRRLLALYGAGADSVTSLGLGDGLNDAGMLNTVDIAVLMPSPALPQLQTAVPRGRAAAWPGPRGWNQAVLEFLAAPAAE